jgi:hypothetical protein
MDRNKLQLDIHYLGVSSGVPKAISMPMVHSVQTVHLSCVNIKTVSKRIEMSFRLIHVTYEYNQMSPKWFLSLYYVRRKPCTYVVSRLTLSPNRLKWASTWPTSPQVCPKRFKSQWYIRRKPCTYLASRLILSPNGSKWASTWQLSHRSTIGDA